MAPTPLRRSSAARALPLALVALAGLAGPAAASSVLVVGGETRTPSVAVAGHAGAARRTPAECATAFHARFAAIRDGEFAALKAAAGTEAGAADAALPGGLLFPPAGRAQAGDNAAALRAAGELAKARGRSAGPLDANARWIAARIREDLGDFLSQKETPFLCSGIADYLETLRAQAARIEPSPARLTAQVAAQREAARASLVAARAALRPAPLPRFAPADRPGEALVASHLRSSVGLGDGEVYGPVMRVANRQDVRVSEGSSDPDLPPLKASAALASEQDVARTIRDLANRAEAAGALDAPAQTDPMRTGAIPLVGPVRPDPRPALGLLAELRPRLLGPAAPPAADANRRADLVRALSDLEALDYLLAAEREPPHPLPAALEATFAAIAAAHADACACEP
ncbi:hypothetical protein D3218_12250 [Aureimonas flava]|uniref:Uncharacterized protein n=1 Tax=Aureimonas flava TaxID=2320271 RepID=A0A3A1WIJ5_9HYPH|nr:hypothetical protein [Aureimonas flava]RIY00066.1 hypothetical protein D3218_12250 [Aureimonas flava]